MNKRKLMPIWGHLPGDVHSSWHYPRRLPRSLPQHYPKSFTNRSLIDRAKSLCCLHVDRSLSAQNVLRLDLLVIECDVRTKWLDKFKFLRWPSRSNGLQTITFRKLKNKATKFWVELWDNEEQRTIQRVLQRLLRTQSLPNQLYQCRHGDNSVKTNFFRVRIQLPTVIGGLAWHSGCAQKYGPGKPVLILEHSKLAQFALPVYMVLLVSLMSNCFNIIFNKSQMNETPTKYSINVIADFHAGIFWT